MLPASKMFYCIGLVTAYLNNNLIVLLRHSGVQLSFSHLSQRGCYVFFPWYPDVIKNVTLALHGFSTVACNNCQYHTTVL